MGRRLLWESLRLCVYGVSGFVARGWFDDHVHVTMSSNGKVKRCQVEIEIPTGNAGNSADAGNPANAGQHSEKTSIGGQRQEMMSNASWSNFLRSFAIMRNFDEAVRGDADDDVLQAASTSPSTASVEGDKVGARKSKKKKKETSTTNAATTASDAEATRGGGGGEGRGGRREVRGRKSSDAKKNEPEEALKAEAAEKRAAATAAATATAVATSTTTAATKNAAAAAFTATETANGVRLARKAVAATAGATAGATTTTPKAAATAATTTIANAAADGKMEVWIDVEDIPWRRTHLEQMIIHEETEMPSAPS